jgi:UDP-3-O-[3-hydroxymyristoyl] N-acetylglucosamine deacetylase
LGLKNTMKAGRQTTLRSRAEISGVGVHSGLPVSLTLYPADAHTGIVFIRTDQAGSDCGIQACAEAVVATDFATVLGHASGTAVSTVEHLMATFCALGVDNVIVELDGPEVPVMDGSAMPFVNAIDAAGIVSLAAARRCLRVLKPIGVVAGDSYAELRPHRDGFRIEVEIDFPDRVIGRQSVAMSVDAASFRRDLARARTFGFMRDVEGLWAAGRALGASTDNTIVLYEDRVLNPEGLRYADEFVRHKALDAIGDLALAGFPIQGAYRSIKGGHRLNHAVLRALIADPSAWTMVEERAPARAPRGRVDAGIGLAQPAFAPEI